MEKTYIQHQGVAVANDSRFAHVMAISLNPKTSFNEGLIRCVLKRSGDVSIGGFIDRSELYLIKRNPAGIFEIGEKVDIEGEDKVIEHLKGDGFDFQGLEDPDIFIDDASKIHVYFTLPMLSKVKGIKNKIHLGHAVGENLSSLRMAQPVLLADDIGGAKELCVAPVNQKGFRYNLVESSKRELDFHYSVVRVAIVEDMSSSWSFGDIVFHPKEHLIPWIAGHASPGPLFPESFIDVGKGKRLGLMNGREVSVRVDGKTHYGIFSVGLFIYDYENGKIEWVSQEPFIRDVEARTITFASQFVETGLGEGVLYAHVDDSFVRAYTLKADLIKSLLPKSREF